MAAKVRHTAAQMNLIDIDLIVRILLGGYSTGFTMFRLPCVLVDAHAGGQQRTVRQSYPLDRYLHPDREIRETVQLSLELGRTVSNDRLLEWTDHERCRGGNNRADLTLDIEMRLSGGIDAHV